ncbi:MAG: COG1361 S-layer family protein [Candidatus Woesearchaeota archaeon]
MRNKWVVSVITLMLLIGLSIVWADSYATPELQVTLLSQEPDPVEPGEIVIVKFKIENQGTQTTQDAIVKLLLKYPFTIYGDSAEKNIGKLKAFSTGADAAIVEFKLKIDEQAVEGDAPLDLLVQMGEGAVSYTNDEFLISIQTRKSLLAITSITTDPSPISPGETAKVNIMVKNTANSLFRSINFKLDLSGSTIPLAPYQSTSERVIPQLSPNYQQTLAFSLIATPNAVSGLYKVPVNITYYDEKGTKYTINDVLAIIVGEKPNLNIYLKKSTVMKAKSSGKITIEIANAGNTDLKYAQLILNPSDDYQLVTTRNYFYLGNINSDDTQSEEIDVFLTPKNAGVVHIPGTLKYVDATNKEYQQPFDLELKTYSSSELRKFGVVQSSNSWIYVLLILLIVGGIFGYRYWKKKKNGNNNKK